MHNMDYISQNRGNVDKYAKCEACVRNNDNVYVVMAYGIGKDKLCGASVPDTQRKLCQKAPEARSLD